MPGQERPRASGSDDDDAADGSVTLKRPITVATSTEMLLGILAPEQVPFDDSWTEENEAQYQAQPSQPWRKASIERFEKHGNPSENLLVWRVCLRKYGLTPYKMLLQMHIVIEVSDTILEPPVYDGDPVWTKDFAMSFARLLCHDFFATPNAYHGIARLALLLQFTIICLYDTGEPWPMPLHDEMNCPILSKLRDEVKDQDSLGSSDESIAQRHQRIRATYKGTTSEVSDSEKPASRELTFAESDMLAEIAMCVETNPEDGMNLHGRPPYATRSPYPVYRVRWEHLQILCRALWCSKQGAVPDVDEAEWKNAFPSSQQLPRLMKKGASNAARYWHCQSRGQFHEGTIDINPNAMVEMPGEGVLDMDEPDELEDASSPAGLRRKEDVGTIEIIDDEKSIDHVEDQPQLPIEISSSPEGSLHDTATPPPQSPTGMMQVENENETLKNKLAEEKKLRRKAQNKANLETVAKETLQRKFNESERIRMSLEQQLAEAREALRRAQTESKQQATAKDATAREPAAAESSHLATNQSTAREPTFRGSSSRRGSGRPENAQATAPRPSAARNTDGQPGVEPGAGGVQNYFSTLEVLGEIAPVLRDIRLVPRYLRQFDLLQLVPIVSWDTWTTGGNTVRDFQQNGRMGVWFCFGEVIQRGAVSQAGILPANPICSRHSILPLGSCVLVCVRDVEGTRALNFRPPAR